MVDADGNKVCSRCSESKKAEGNFYRISQKNSDGFHGYCIPCVKAKAVEWQKANPEKKAASDRKQDQKPERRAKKIVRGRSWRAKNPEKVRAAWNRWHEANPEKRDEIVKRYQKNNPEKVVAAQAKYHASDRYKSIHADRERLRRAVVREVSYADGRVERTLDGKFTVVEWQAVLAAFNHKCAYCDAAERMTIEHLTPLSRGGRNEVGNIAPACSPCNTTKNDKTVEEFAPDRAQEIRDRAMLN